MVPTTLNRFRRSDVKFLQRERGREGGRGERRGKRREKGGEGGRREEKGGEEGGEVGEKRLITRPVRTRTRRDPENGPDS
jgi:hypothetical protein